MATDHHEIRAALQILGFEVACADSVLIGDQPVAIADIARHGLPWVLATFFSLDAGPTPPSPSGGYPMPSPPIGTALPAPRRRHLPSIPPPPRPSPPPALEELTVDDLWGDSQLWGESNVDGDDVEFVDPFDAGFREESDIDGGHGRPDGEDSGDDDKSSTLIVWVPEEITRKLVEVLGGDPGTISRDPQVLLKLMAMLRELQENASADGGDDDDSSSVTGFLNSLEHRLQDSIEPGDESSLFDINEFPRDSDDD